MGSRAGRTLGVGNPKGGRSPPFPLYICEVLGLLDTRERLPLGAALPLSLLVSCSAWRSPAGVPRSSTTTTPSCCCWMESSQPLPLSLLDQGVGDVTGLHVC